MQVEHLFDLLVGYQAGFDKHLAYEGAGPVVGREEYVAVTKSNVTPGIAFRDGEGAGFLSEVYKLK